jgi:hypothetical protein
MTARELEALWASETVTPPMTARMPARLLVRALAVAGLDVERRQIERAALELRLLHDGGAIDYRADRLVLPERDRVRLARWRRHRAGAMSVLADDSVSSRADVCRTSSETPLVGDCGSEGSVVAAAMRAAQMHGREQRQRRCCICLVATAGMLGPPVRWRARRATSCVCIGSDGFGRLRESALRRILLTIRGHLTEAGAAVTDATQQPRTPVNGRCELTGPGRKPQEPATRAGCSDSVPHTPCPCGLSAVQPPGGQQTYLQPSWDERAPSRPTHQRPSSLPQSPRGFASSSSRSFRKRHLHSSLYRLGGVSGPEIRLVFGLEGSSVSGPLRRTKTLFPRGARCCICLDAEAATTAR